MQGPCENDLVILRCVDEHIIEVFGVIEEVERTFLNDGEGELFLHNYFSCYFQS